MCNYAFLYEINDEDHSIPLFIANIIDISYQKRMEQRIRDKEREMEQAFSFSLPNSKIEKKLKSTPEYKDKYDPDTGKITISEVIEDGCYRHVVNALKILADLKRMGVMSIIGIDKETLVDVAIFHDLGKAQPILSVGEKVNPKEVFDDGKLHAERSALIAKHYYEKHDDIINLVFYHHHLEEELPSEFPDRLLPMFRLFKLVDGLSAALTRREAFIDIKVKQENVFIKEINNHPDYNKNWVINLFTGSYEMYPVSF